MDLLRRIALAAPVALAGLVAAAGAQAEPPESISKTRGFVSAHVENSVCPDFAPAEFVLTGPSHSHYKLLEPDVPFEEGWIHVKLSASIAGHEYSVHQRYSFPKDFRDLVYGFAVTVIKRDDGATMQGDSVLGIDAIDFREEINWLETPTCTPPRH
jgi:hypothetical protein